MPRFTIQVDVVLGGQYQFKRNCPSCGEEAT